MSEIVFNGFCDRKRLDINHFRQNFLKMFFNFILMLYLCPKFNNVIYLTK